MGNFRRVVSHTPASAYHLKTCVHDFLYERNIKAIYDEKN